MPSKSKIRALIFVLAAFVALPAFVAAGMAQDNASIPGDPSFANNASWRAPAANLYVSVRESTGLPVSANALVKLSCPLAGIDVSGAAQGTGAQVQFHNVPAGDCNIEVSAQGYRTAKDRTEITQSLTSHNQYVFIYMHPESESAEAATRPPLVPLGLIKEMDKAMEAMQKKRDAGARKHLDRAAKIAPTNPDGQVVVVQFQHALHVCDVGVRLSGQDSSNEPRRRIPARHAGIGQPQLARRRTILPEGSGFFAGARARPAWIGLCSGADESGCGSGANA